MSTINLTIQNLKSISELNIELEYERGLYALTGENGVGKSTIFAVLAKLVYQGALHKYFRNDGDRNTRIRFVADNVENTWVKNPNWRRQHTEKDISLNGTYEASLLFGSRFDDAHKSSLSKGNYISQNNLVEADSFVSENLGKILRDDARYYANLMQIKTKQLSSDLGFKGQPHFFEVNNRWLPQFYLSSGEMLLIELLRFINDRRQFNKRNNHNDLTFILVDEIDLALHPSAQDRLMTFLTELAGSENLCIYFATHSLQIINRIEPSNIYHIVRTSKDKLEVVNPCYPAYATRSLYTNDGFDFLILVEDVLAKYVVESVIRRENLYQSKLIKVLPCGGWEQTLDMHYELKQSAMAGKNCKIFSVLDGDIEEEYKQKYGTDSKFSSLTKYFLPIQSIERHLNGKLIISQDFQFQKAFGDRFFPYRSLDDIISDYKNNVRTDPSSSKYKNGKTFYNVLVSCIAEQDVTKDRFEHELCEFISTSSDFSSLARTLQKKLT